MDLIVWYTYSHTTPCDSWVEVYGPLGLSPHLGAPYPIL